MLNEASQLLAVAFWTDMRAKPAHLTLCQVNMCVAQIIELILSIYLQLRNAIFYVLLQRASCCHLKLGYCLIMTFTDSSGKVAFKM